VPAVVDGLGSDALHPGAQHSAHLLVDGGLQLIEALACSRALVELLEQPAHKSTAVVRLGWTQKIKRHYGIKSYALHSDQPEDKPREEMKDSSTLNLTPNAFASSRSSRSVIAMSLPCCCRNHTKSASSSSG
jgi:hypothetical protein